MRISRIILSVLLAIFTFCADGLAFKDGDFQYWNTESVSGKVTEDLKYKLEAEFRFGDDSSDFYYQHTDLGFTYTGLAEWLDVGANYRQIFEEDNDDWEYENRPHLNATLKHEIEGYKLSNRNRLEYRDKENGNDGWRYRNKSTVKLPYKFTELEIQPYVADEFFVDFDKEKLNRNRLYAGAGFKIIKDLKGDIFYLRQSSESNDKWTDYNILGTKLNLSF